MTTAKIVARAAVRCAVCGSLHKSVICRETLTLSSEIKKENSYREFMLQARMSFERKGRTWLLWRYGDPQKWPPPDSQEAAWHFNKGLLVGMFSEEPVEAAVSADWLAGYQAGRGLSISRHELTNEHLRSKGLHPASVSFTFSAI